MASTNKEFTMLAPSPGESISEIEISKWMVKNGDYVKKDQKVLEIESEKASLELVAEQTGVISILSKEGDIVAVGSKIATIDTSKKPPKTQKPAEVKPAETPAKKDADSSTLNINKPIPSVAAEKIIAESNLSAGSISGSGHQGRITKGDVLQELSKVEAQSPTAFERQTTRKTMSLLRRNIAQRLVAVKNETAMLTTFNEVDMSAIMNIRKEYKESFKEKHQIGLGFMSFFAKASAEALLEFPAINSQIEGEDIIGHNYVDLGIAVSAPKGLMVPIIRNAQSLTMAEIEKQIATLAKKARDNAISIDEMSGGTFTITNGGVFGSMLSTPIINPPQSAILGMHNIVQRPVAVNGEVAIRPIMYLALSYDHRIVDGKDSVTFLYHIKSLLEDPIRLLLAV